MSRRLIATVTLTAFAAAPTALAQWVTYEDVTSLRLPAEFNDPSLTINDTQEKDYAWGDLDNDGDIDVVVVRKQPFTSVGKDTNLLLMNEGIAEGHALDGVFIDRTVEYASVSDVPGDNGFLTATNDRDIALVDVDGDGWLDMVTAPTLTDNETKALSHPRVYMNLGEKGGQWLGFRHEDGRIPQMHPFAGPRFCSVAAGDLTGDGAPDLYFGDYDSGEAGPQLFDFNNRLLINDGNGFFIDETDLRLTSEMSESAFGAATVLADMNNDGSLDVVKQTSLNAPQHVAVTYNSPTNPGEFVAYDIFNADAPYFVSVGDLNNDGRLDVVVVDDGTDTYHLHNSIQNGIVQFTQRNFPSGPSAGFGGNSFIADLNNDGFNDVIVTDVDVDIPGCSRVTAIYRNDGAVPNVGFDVPPNGIPQSELTGVHDVAVFDIDLDGWLDLIIGQCDGMKIYRAVPPTGIDFEYPNGRPAVVSPDVDTQIVLSAAPFGGDIEDGSLELVYSANSLPAVAVPFTASGDTFSATIPGQICFSSIQWSVRGVVNGTQFTDPPNPTVDPFRITVATGTETILANDMEGDVAGWEASFDGIPDGRWEVAQPNGTIVQGQVAAPFEDASADGTRAWVTGNGTPSGGAGADDVDFGPVYLESPVFDGTGNVIVRFKQWFFCNNGNDVFRVQISANGGNTYIDVPALTTSGTGGAWEEVAFRVADFAPAAPEMRIRFVAMDNPNDSITEAGIDDFSVERLTCGAPPCPTDVDGSGATDFNDLITVLAAWGACDGCSEDVNIDGTVDFGDLLEILSAFGDCP